MACESALLTIREVEAATGIKAVTLRAWQRRYGLLNPERSAKGHRLYSQQDMQRIQQILYWVDRGVAIGKVKVLLEQPDAVAEVHSSAGDEVEQLLQLLMRGEAEKLETKLRDIFQLYPFKLAEREYIQPVELALQRQSLALQQIWYGLWRTSLLREYLLQIQHAQANPQSSILLLSFEAAGALSSWRAAACLSSLGYRCRMIDGLQHLDQDMQNWLNSASKPHLAFHAEHKLAPKLLSQLLKLIETAPQSSMILGEIGQIHRQVLLACGAELVD